MLTPEQAAELTIKTVISGALCARLEWLVDQPGTPQERLTKLLAEVDSDLSILDEFLSSRVGHTLVGRDDLYREIFATVRVRLGNVVSGLRPASLVTDRITILNALKSARNKLAVTTLAEQAGMKLFT